MKAEESVEKRLRSIQSFRNIECLLCARSWAAGLAVREVGREPEECVAG